MNFKKILASVAACSVAIGMMAMPAAAAGTKSDTVSSYTITVKSGSTTVASGDQSSVTVVSNGDQDITATTATLSVEIGGLTAEHKYVVSGTVTIGYSFDGDSAGSDSVVLNLGTGKTIASATADGNSLGSASIEDVSSTSTSATKITIASVTASLTVKDIVENTACECADCKCAEGACACSSSECACGGSDSCEGGQGGSAGTGCDCNPEGCDCADGNCACVDCKCETCPGEPSVGGGEDDRFGGIQDTTGWDMTPGNNNSGSTTTEEAPKPTPSVTAKDEESGVEVAAAEGVLEEGTKLVVEPDSLAFEIGDVSIAFAAYDITLEKDGAKVNPNGTVTVSIEVPDDLLAMNADTYYVYYYNPDDESFTDMKATFKDGKVVFDTNHFSIYVISAIPLDPGTSDPGTSDPGTSDPGTGSGADNDPSPDTGVAIVLIPAIAAAAGVVISRKTK